MRLIVCDRCRQEINGVKKTGYINLDKRDIATGELEGNREFDEWDLCDDCLMQIRDFLHMAPLSFQTKCLNMPWDMNRIMPKEEPGQQAEAVAPAQKEQPSIEDNNEKTDSAIAEEPVEKKFMGKRWDNSETQEAESRQSSQSGADEGEGQIRSKPDGDHGSGGL